MEKDCALLIIDAQMDMFAAGSRVFAGEKMLQRLSDLVARARRAQVPVVYVQNNGTEIDPDMPGTPGWEIQPELKPEEGETVIQKWSPDAFHETGLQGVLTGLGVRRLVIAGMQSEYCVNATTRRAHELGYEVTLVKDAHSTYDGGGLSAAQIIAQYNGALGEMVKLEEADKVSFE